MANLPWYRKAHRWCQCNLTEPDAQNWDTAFWKKYWKDNGIQGIIVNAGGTVAYYPSEDPHQYRSKFLGERDLLKEIIDAAHEEGLAAIARMDISMGHEELYAAHPDWFFHSKDGEAMKISNRYLTCLSGGYFSQQIPKLMKEVIERYHPDGIADNSWTGMVPIDTVCYCENCRRQFREDSGLELPEKTDYLDPAFLAWQKWNIARRANIYRDYNTLVSRLGGDDCLWMGMLMADPYPTVAGDTLFSRPYGAPQVRALNKAIVVDAQARECYFDQNSFNGMVLHEAFDEDTLIIQSSSCYYNAAGKMMRRAADPPEEVQTWMLAGISAGTSPMAHIIGATQRDSRIFDNPVPVYAWHRENEEYLYNRSNAANVGVVWSDENLLFYGAKTGITENVRQPLWGMLSAMRNQRIGYFPVNAAQIGEKSGRMKLLVLPNVGAMSDADLDAVVAFVQNGGSIVFSGTVGAMNEQGAERQNNPLEELLDIHSGTADNITLSGEVDLIGRGLHNYFSLDNAYHPIFAGLEGTDMVGAGARAREVTSHRLQPIAHMMPVFPVYPPEFAYIEESHCTKDIPAILAGDTGYGGRAVYFAAGLDSSYEKNGFPDLGVILGNAIRWAVQDDLPFRVSGAGELDCKLYRQKEGERLVLSILNLSGINKSARPVVEHFCVGPQEVTVQTGGRKYTSVTLKCGGQTCDFTSDGNEIHFTVPYIDKQELIVIE